jgi:hypothetical protein
VLVVYQVPWILLQILLYHLTSVIPVVGGSHCRIGQLDSWSPSQVVPTDLWEKIFSFACLDDGSTGRSLSLVSRYVCEISKPFKFRSLAIRNLRQAEALPFALTHRDPIRQPVHHLFVLCDPEQMYPSVQAIQRKATSPSLLRRITSMLSRVRSKQRPPRRQQSHFDKILATMFRNKQPVSPIILETLMAIAVSRILIAVSPTLRTLSISIASPVSFISFEGSPALPVLEELTITYGNGGFGIMPARLLASFHPLTSLRRLNLRRFYHLSDAPEMLRQISKLAPNVKLVMLPWIRTGWSDYSNTRLSFPVRAATIYIQLPTPSPSLSSQLHNRITISDCQRLAENDDRIIFQQADQESWEFNGRELEREWEARINGDDGCWTTDDIIDLPICLDKDVWVFS